MAYNKRNFYERIVEIQAVTMEHQKGERFLLKEIFWQKIQPRWKISYRTYSKYLGINAKRGLKNLLKEQKKINNSNLNHNQKKIMSVTTKRPRINEKREYTEVIKQLSLLAIAKTTKGIKQWENDCLTLEQRRKLRPSDKILIVSHLISRAIADLKKSEWNNAIHNLVTAKSKL